MADPPFDQAASARKALREWSREFERDHPRGPDGRFVRKAAFKRHRCKVAVAA